MSGRRSRPFLIAPLIPGWAILGFFGVEQTHGSAYFLTFAVLWSGLGLALFGYILRQALAARRRQAR